MSGKPTMIIIGAGIAGLATGCYAQMNGFDSQIFELHTLPGGLCTSWRRQGYTFDGCIHWLVGSNPRASSNVLWRELGVAQGRKFVEHDVFIRYEGTGGRAFNLSTDPDRLEADMKAISPQDSALIEEFTGAIRKLARMDMPVGQPEGLVESAKAGLGLLPYLRTLRKYSQITMDEFFGRCLDPFLREAIDRAWGLPEMPVVGLMMALAYMHARNAGYPIGGSLVLAQDMEKRYLDLGGQVHYQSRVAKILVESGVDGDQAVGIQTAGGHEQRADVIVSAADGHATIFDMLGGRYVDQEIRAPYERWPIFQPIIQVSLGIARDLSNQPAMVTLALTDPVTVGGEPRHEISIRHFCYDPTMAPPGKSVAVSMFMSNHAFWKDVATEPEHYEAEKQRAATAVIDQLESRLPGITGQIEVVDVATPLTTERYTGNWQGSMEGWMLTKDTMKMAMSGKGMRKTLPGLANFYMAGQWVEPGGGVPTAAISGRNLVQQLCKQAGRSFVTSEA